ncbi:MAG: type IV pilus assembly protein PilM [Candidatus Pacebacteria bacterium]|nr:type IV pilus assembly protein PilM [Candidatus Paceibacterota bacterium]
MSLFSKNLLGIDIGAASIKIVEISVSGKKKKLENYIEFKMPLKEDSLKTFHGENLVLLSDEVSKIVQALLKRAKIKDRKIALSLPDFSTFFTTFSLPPMTEAEAPQAVEFEARHYIPLPLNEVTFDWQIVEKEETPSGVKMKVLLVAVPNIVLQNYQRMANLAQLEITGMEAEVFSLIRSSWPSGKYEFLPVCMIDFGWESTTVSIVERKRLAASFSFDVSSIALTRDLSVALKISMEEAEKLKLIYGLDPQKPEIAKALLDKISILALEAEKICNDFQQATAKRVENIILAGGTAGLFGLKEYLSARMKKNVFTADPFSAVNFPLVLNKRLKQIGPSFAVALGAAMMAAD